MRAIIPVYPPKCQDKYWKTYLKEAITDPFELLSQLGLTPQQLNFRLDPQNPFAMRVPQPFIDKMNKGDPADPLLLQVITQQTENIEINGFSRDPLAENNNQTAGVLHKYHGRVLLVLASACAVNCRYCFRRHFPYHDQHSSGEHLERALTYISHTESISEVILSGGDPLIVSDGSLIALVERLETIPHLKRLRIHTRLPVVIPQRITHDLANNLRNTRLQTCMVLHINHPNEIDSLLVRQLQKLSGANIQLLNQSVLLKSINDDANTLCELSEKLFDAQILPYYLHLLDKVQGAAHFEVTDRNAVQLINAMRLRLPGYLVPRLAREKAGEGSKTLIA